MSISFPRPLGEITYEFDYFCLAKGTQILCRASNREISLKRVEDIVSGDHVLSLDKQTRSLQWKRASLTKRTAPESLVRIRAGTLLDVTHTHRMILSDFSEVPAGNLKVGDSLLEVDKIDLPEEINEINLYEEANLTELPEWLSIEGNFCFHIRKRGRGKGKFCKEGKTPLLQKLDYDFGVFLGLYLAEGSASPQNSISFAFHAEEEELSTFIQDFSSKKLDIVAKTTVTLKYTRRVTALHRKAFAFLWKSAVPGCCYDKQLPNWVFRSPLEFRRGVIHGWLFGDGHKGARSVSGKTVSSALCYGLQTLALSLGIKSSVSLSDGAYKLSFFDMDNIQKLFPGETIWKHKFREEGRETKGKLSIKEIRQEFESVYEEGMSKEEFLKRVSFSEGPVARAFGSWAKMLYRLGNRKISNRCKGLTREEVLTAGIKWLEEHNWVFSFSEWQKSRPNVPSQGYIYKYFSGRQDFLDAAKDFSKGGESLEPYSSERKVTYLKEIEYKDDFVYDLSVEDNQNFLVGNIITHNSGSQCLIYCEEVLIDDTLRIAWNVMQERTPVWGYATQYYNALAAGVVLVNGALWIAYKEAGYMPLILKYIADRRAGGGHYASPALLPESGTTSTSDLASSVSVWQGTAEGGGRRAGRVSRANIETLLRLQERDPEDAQVQAELQRMILALGAMSDRDFESVAETFEDAIWYGVNQGGDNGDRQTVMSGNLAGPPGDWLASRRVDQYPPVDLIITFGDMNNPTANHSLQRLMDVTFTGTEFAAIDNNGEPVVVRFDFIARNMA